MTEIGKCLPEDRTEGGVKWGINWRVLRDSQDEVARCVFCGELKSGPVAFITSPERLAFGEEREDLGVSIEGNSLCGDCACSIMASAYHHLTDRRLKWDRPYRGRHQMRVPDELRSEIMDLYNATCVYCGAGKDLSLDHVDPHGEETVENLVAACVSCNSSKQRRGPGWAGHQMRAEARRTFNEVAGDGEECALCGSYLTARGRCTRCSD